MPGKSALFVDKLFAEIGIPFFIYFFHSMNISLTTISTLLLYFDDIRRIKGKEESCKGGSTA
jgi:hypothetical protein